MNWHCWIQLYLEIRIYIYQPVACVAIVIQCASLNFYLLMFSKSSNLDHDNLPTYLISHIDLIPMHYWYENVIL